MTFSTLPLPVAIGDYPIGAILSFAGILNRDQIQAQGWLYCNGDSISRTQYADLFAVIGSAFSSGDGVSTFNLPDFRGCFLRGADNGAKVDPDAGSRTASRPGSNTGPIVGSAQSHATGLPRNDFIVQTAGGHTHQVAHVPKDYSGNPMAGSSQAIWKDGSVNTSTAGAHSHRIVGGDAETVPMNDNVYFVIKFKEVPA